MRAMTPIGAPRSKPIAVELRIGELAHDHSRDA
jgi:hypothetical protein